MPLDAIRSVETIIVSIPREVPYLGPLRPGESINRKGYIIRKGNRTIYPSTDMSVLVKVTGESGRVGWGETYGIVAPKAVTAIIDDVFAPVVSGRDPAEAAAIHQDLYDLMRVRGACGGYYGDALAGIDIAIWDLFGKARNLPVSALIGSRRLARIPAYVSGLPKATLKERCDLALEWVGKGFKGIKFAAAMSDEGIIEEMAALREAIGPKVDLMVDLHWKFTADEAIALIHRLEPCKPYFAEAPCAPEDFEGQAEVARNVDVPIALGEEWRSVYEYRPRFAAKAMSIVQPEMGHTGITEFQGIGALAHKFDAAIIPHASIGCGIFMAASLQAASTLQNLPYHEYQHSIFDKNLRFATGDMACAGGFYTVPTGPGVGVEPRDEVFKYVIG